MITPASLTSDPSSGLAQVLLLLSRRCFFQPARTFSAARLILVRVVAPTQPIQTSSRRAWMLGVMEGLDRTVSLLYTLSTKVHGKRRAREPTAAAAKVWGPSSTQPDPRPGRGKGRDRFGGCRAYRSADLDRPDNVGSPSPSYPSLSSSAPVVIYRLG